MENFEKRYGALYINLDKDKLTAIVFTFVFLIRRLAFAYTICFVDKNITFQILVLDFLSTILLSYYICAKPMQDAINNFVHIFNEVIILVCAWSLFLFTDYVPDPLQRHSFGYYYLTFIAINFLVNLCVLILTLLF